MKIKMLIVFFQKSWDVFTDECTYSWRRNVQEGSVAQLRDMKRWLEACSKTLFDSSLPMVDMAWLAVWKFGPIHIGLCARTLAKVRVFLGARVRSWVLVDYLGL